MVKKIFVVALSLVSVFAYAGRTNCPAAKVVHIQIEGQKVLYLQEGAPWRTLGALSNEDGTRERYSALLAAQASGRRVLVAYGDGYDCDQTNYTASAELLRTYN